jgi:PAS domain S-box-containing protein
MFEQLFERADDPAFVIDPIADLIVDANSAACAMLGFTCEELLATPVSRIHPGELPQLREFVEGVLREGQGSTITLTCRTKSGGFLPADMTLLAFDAGGRINILGLVRDRSEHRQPDPCD